MLSGTIRVSEQECQKRLFSYYLHVLVEYLTFTAVRKIYKQVDGSEKSETKNRYFLDDARDVLVLVCVLLTVEIS